MTAQANALMSVSVVIPMYNEEECVHDILSSLSAVLSSHGVEYEIIAVNDHSTDTTAEKVMEERLRCPSIILAHNRGGQGLGNALKAGFAAASKDLVLYTDADLPCAPEEMLAAMRVLLENDADIVSAYRSNPSVCPVHRRVYSFVYNTLVGLCLRTGVRDVNFAFKLIKRCKLAELDIASRGSFVNAEIFSRARSLRLRIVQYPARYTPRRKGCSKLDTMSNIAEIVREMGRYMFGKNGR